MALGTAGAILGSAVIGGVGSALGANATKNAANSAANATQQAAQQNTALQQGIYNTNLSQLSPFISQGAMLGGRLGNALGFSGSTTSTPAAYRQFLTQYGQAQPGPQYQALQSNLPTSANMQSAIGGISQPTNALAGLNPNVANNIPRYQQITNAAGNYNPITANALTSNVTQPKAVANSVGSYNPITAGRVSDPNNALVSTATNSALNPGSFEDYKQSTGYQNRLDESLKAVQSSAAARGLLQSGATVKGILSEAGNLASAERQNFVGELRDYTNQQDAFNLGQQGRTDQLTRADQATNINLGLNNAQNQLAYGQNAQNLAFNNQQAQFAAQQAQDQFAQQQQGVNIGVQQNNAANQLAYGQNAQSVQGQNASNQLAYGQAGNALAQGNFNNAYNLGGAANQFGQQAFQNQFDLGRYQDTFGQQGFQNALALGQAQDAQAYQERAYRDSLATAQQGRGDQQWNNWLSLLSGQQGTGLSAASALAGVGQNYANAASVLNTNSTADRANALLAAGTANAGMYNGIAGSIGNALGQFQFGQRNPYGLAAGSIY